MEPASVRANDFGDGCGEGDDVVLDLGLDLKNTINVEVGALADGLGGFLGHDAGGSQRFGGGNLHGQPGAKTVFVAPNAAHLGPGITWNHGTLS